MLEFEPGKRQVAVAMAHATRGIPDFDDQDALVREVAARTRHDPLDDREPLARGPQPRCGLRAVLPR